MSLGCLPRNEGAAVPTDRAPLAGPVGLCESAEFADAWPPSLNSAFSCGKFDRDTSVDRPRWQGPFDAYLNKLKKVTL
jgi:hypothetical protein